MNFPSKNEGYKSLPPISVQSELVAWPTLSVQNLHRQYSPLLSTFLSFSLIDTGASISLIPVYREKTHDIWQGLLQHSSSSIKLFFSNLRVNTSRLQSSQSPMRFLSHDNIPQICSGSARESLVFKLKYFYFMKTR